MGQSLGLLAGSLLLMVVAAELFTNAIEWVGSRLNLAEGATGSLLAAVGTTLPESIVPVVALVGGRPGATGIAVGAIVGAPLLLATAGAAITALAALAARRRWLAVDVGHVRRDLTTFLVSFGLLIGSTVLPRPVHLGLAVLLVLLYGAYVARTLRAARGGPAAFPEPLHLLRLGRRPVPGGTPARPGWLPLVVQVMVGAAALVVAGNLFVAALHGLAAGVRLPALVLSLILVPIATELPETLAGVLWVRGGHDGLALGNIAGAMVLQSTLPAVIGLGFTPWRLTRPALLAAAAAAAGALLMLACLRRGRGLEARAVAVGGLCLYAAYVAAALGLRG
ncbi:MAG TPA: sodium:calcium antiporter [Candidatus Micrarchaeia archaeon]|nr:sodium:calcium antiporter [Candidatus Micrarchaeia archaeon]